MKTVPDKSARRPRGGRSLLPTRSSILDSEITKEGGGPIAEERTVTLDLGEDVRVAVVAEQTGAVLVSDAEIVAKLSSVTKPIERVSREVLEAVKRAAPSKATVELGFGLAIEAGQLIALFGKGKGEASIKVTLEWEGASEKAKPG